MNYSIVKFDKTMISMLLRKPQYKVMNKLSKSQEISKGYRETRMSNARMQEIVTRLFVHNDVVQVHKYFSIDYDINLEYGKQGYATEAAIKLLKFYFMK